LLTASVAAPERPAGAARPAGAVATTGAAMPETQGARIAGAAVRLALQGGGRSLTLSLAPVELGRVAITISHDAAGTATLVLAVERPATLALLRHEVPTLQAAFDRAGLALDRHVAIHLATADATPAVADAAPSAGAAADPGAGALARRDAAPDGGQPRGYPRRQAAAGRAEASLSITPSGVAGSVRAGLDITA
jgi:hypothetical protein